MKKCVVNEEEKERHGGKRGTGKKEAKERGMNGAELLSVRVSPSSPLIN